VSRLVIAGLVVGAGLVGIIGLWVKDMGDELARRAEIIAGLKAAQDHDPCLDIIVRQWDELDRIQHERAIERGQAMVAEVEQWLEGQES
jgi:hypothetical protein